VLEARFDALVEQRTGYPNSDGVLQEMRAQRADLRRVLERPEVPLHNNARESDSRAFVKRRKLSGGTRNGAGRRCRDTFASLKKACRKLGVRFWAYLQDRVRGLGQIPRLAELLRQKARQTPAPVGQAVPVNWTKRASTFQIPRGCQTRRQVVVRAEPGSPQFRVIEKLRGKQLTPGPAWT
jgi:hypothetical protein